jgi:uncharacterized protein
MPTLETNLQTIQQNSIAKQAENDAFVSFLQQQPSATIDALVSTLYQQIEPQINCLNCGNCCKSLMINVTETEANSVSQYLQISRQTFDEQYLEKGSSMMIVNTIPCHFLQSNNACSIYPQRFSGCKEFPALHIPNFTGRLFTVFMHYNRCPIVYNVVEVLKTSAGFSGS